MGRLRTAFALRRLFADTASWIRFALWKARADLSLPRGELRLRLRGDDEPIWIRPGTSDEEALREIEQHGEYGFVLEHLRAPLRRIVDLGANVGVSVRYWQRHFPGVEVLAVEPDPGNAALLERNLHAAVARSRARVVRAGIGARAGERAIDRSRGDWAIRLVEPTAAGAEARVRVLTVADLLREGGMAGVAIDLLKCDIEGSEREVFRDCGEWIAHVRALAIETHPPYAPEALDRDLARAGWRGERKWAQEKAPGLWLSLYVRADRD